MSTMETKITIGRSRELFAAHLVGLATEQISLELARGRVLAELVRCDRALPPFDRVTMDGIAVMWNVANPVGEWQSVGVQYAGDAPLKLENSSQCVEIMTGSKLPIGADSVIPVEWIEAGPDGRFQLRSGESVAHGQFVHLAGSDRKGGDVLLEPGVLLSARQLAVCASVGKSSIEVNRLPEVAYISTGNELVAVDEVPGEVEVRRSNDQAVAAECAKAGIQLKYNLHLKDDASEITARLDELRREIDIIVFSGGVSMGKADYIPGCAQACGFKIIFHKVKQKPGGPILFAKHPDGTVLLGLPGNPLSCMVCSRVYLREVIWKLSGFPLNSSLIVVKGPFPDDSIKARFQPVRLEHDDEHGQIGEIVRSNTSGDMISVLNSDGIVMLPVTQERKTGESLVLEYLDWRH